MFSITTFFVHWVLAHPNGIDLLNEGRLEHLATADVQEDQHLRGESPDHLHAQGHVVLLRERDSLLVC